MMSLNGVDVIEHADGTISVEVNADWILQRGIWCMRVLETKVDMEMPDDKEMGLLERTGRPRQTH